MGVPLLLGHQVLLRPERNLLERRNEGPVQALITGEGELTSWEHFPPLIAIPLGPERGSGFVGDGIADAATIAELKGRHMLLDPYSHLFDGAPRGAA